MSEEKKKGGFWGSLFRSKSRRKGKDGYDDDDSNDDTRDHDDYERRSPDRRRHSEPGMGRDIGHGDDSASPSSSASPVRRPLSKHSGADKGKGKARRDSTAPAGTWRRRRRRGPLTDWPPSNVPSEEDLTLGHAMDLVSRGAPVFTGHRRPVPHASESYYALFATASAGVRGAATDAANLHDAMAQLMTMRWTAATGATRTTSSGRPAPVPAARPWETLEQPSLAFHFGARPGTVALNRWVSRASSLPPTLTLRDTGIALRDADLERIMRRLRELERYGLEDDDEKLMYNNLYGKFLRDRGKPLSPHRTIDKQITDLIEVLSRPGWWIDFSDPRNQIATRFIFDRGEQNHEQYVRFFHQLLFSCELDLRINSSQHSENPREKILAQLPPTIQWSIALSRRWRDNMRIDEFGDTAKQVKLRLKLKRRQMSMLKRFAQMMKWPNLAEMLENMADEDSEDALGAVSSHAMAFFSGLVLPGMSFPFLMMNSLIDVDPDHATDELALLTHLHPCCGFQYRGSYTYWSSASVVGRVLAPTCREVGGWVGPARPTRDLARTQIARIRTRRPRLAGPGTNPAAGASVSPLPPTILLDSTPLSPTTPGPQPHFQGLRLMSPDEVLSMRERSDPLGPPAESFPVLDYDLPRPQGDSAGTGEIVDTVRVEKLTLRRINAPGPVPGTANPSTPMLGGEGQPPPPPAPGGGGGGGGVGVFDAGIQFAIDGASWPLRLSFEVEFVSAWPCVEGPHPLFYEYAYASVPVDRVVEIRDWGGMYGGGMGEGAVSTSSLGGMMSSSAARGKMPQRPPPVVRDPADDSKVLVVEAFGVPDNEVLARAWCAHWGLNAIVADVRKTCMSCAIREAYAATLTVVILVEDIKQEPDR
ncbi:hypothetical protein RB598_000570 [Gaeumannomyces tritici]